MTTNRQHTRTLIETNYLCPKCRQRFLIKDGWRTNSDKTRTQRYACVETDGQDGRIYCYTTTNPTGPVRGHGKLVGAKPRRFARKLDSQLYFITSAQNATPMHEGFFEAIRSWVKDTGGELVVLTMRYQNPTSRWTDSQKNAEYWLVPDELLYNQRKKLNDNLVLIGDVKIRPTAHDPLSGFESITHGESGIFAHTKLRLTTIPTPHKRAPKVLTTTGAITVPNYTDSKAGKKGEFHHVQGGVIVEIVNNKIFHLHHVNCRKRDGAFIWLDKAYYPDGTVERAPAYEAIVFGDVHRRFVDPDVVDATFRKGGLVDVLNPRVLVWHDLLDSYFGNPHHVGNPFIKLAKHRANYHVAQDEVIEAIEFLREHGLSRKNYVVPSNHDDMLSRWIIREDWKRDVATENIEFYLETALVMAQSAHMTDIGADYIAPFGYWINQLKSKTDDITPLKLKQSLMLMDIECGYHGHQGPGGARGTIKNFGAIGVKLITGHGHSEAIWNGHYRGGTMTRLDAEYVFGPNAWLNTHVSIDGFGKRHLHTFVEGDFWA